MALRMHLRSLWGCTGCILWWNSFAGGIARSGLALRGLTRLSCAQSFWNWNGGRPCGLLFFSRIPIFPSPLVAPLSDAVRPGIH